MVQDEIDILGIIVREHYWFRQAVYSRRKIKSAAIVGLDQVIQFFSNYSTIILDSVLCDDDIIGIIATVAVRLYFFLTAGQQQCDHY